LIEFGTGERYDEASSRSGEGVFASLGRTSLLMTASDIATTPIIVPTITQLSIKSRALISTFSSNLLCSRARRPGTCKLHAEMTFYFISMT